MVSAFPKRSERILLFDHTNKRSYRRPLLPLNSPRVFQYPLQRLRDAKNLFRYNGVDPHGPKGMGMTNCKTFPAAAGGSRRMLKTLYIFSYIDHRLVDLQCSKVGFHTGAASMRSHLRNNPDLTELLRTLKNIRD